VQRVDEVKTDVSGLSTSTSVDRQRDGTMVSTDSRHVPLGDQCVWSVRHRGIDTRPP